MLNFLYLHDFFNCQYRRSLIFYVINWLDFEQMVYQNPTIPPTRISLGVLRRHIFARLELTIMKIYNKIAVVQVIVAKICGGGGDKFRASERERHWCLEFMYSIPNSGAPSEAGIAGPCTCSTKLTESSPSQPSDCSWDIQNTYIKAMPLLLWLFL